MCQRLMTIANYFGVLMKSLVFVGAGAFVVAIVFFLVSNFAYESALVLPLTVHTYVCANVWVHELFSSFHLGDSSRPVLLKISRNGK